MEEGGEELVGVTIEAPSTAEISAVDVLIIRVTSQFDGAQNSAVVNVVVSSGEEDTIQPKYVVIDETSCTHLSDSQYACDLEQWFFEGIVYDLESGLGKVNLEFSGDDDSDYNFTIDEFVAGSNDNVSVVFEASCCVRAASLSIIDMIGNAAVKQFDQGPLRGKVDLIHFLTNKSTPIYTKNSHIENPNFYKNHISEISFFTKFTISKSHFSKK